MRTDEEPVADRDSVLPGQLRELGVIRIATPCHRDWEKMTGDARSRFCGDCQLNVYDLSAMTSDEARVLIREKEGELCVRFFRRADGTVLTRDCPVGVTRRRRGLLGAGAGVVALSLAGLAAEVAATWQKPVMCSPVEPIARPPWVETAPPPPVDTSWIEKRRANLVGPLQHTTSQGRMHTMGVLRMVKITP